MSFGLVAKRNKITPFTALVESVMDGALLQLGTHKGIRRIFPATETTEETQDPAQE
jgi:hypothetical protein